MKTFIFYFNIFENVIYSCDAKLNLRQPLLQSSVSHDPSELFLIFCFAAQETFLIILETVVLLNIFPETVIY